MTLRRLLRPWCWIVGHRQGWPTSVTATDATNRVTIETVCCRCGANTLSVHGPLYAGTTLVYKRGKWRRP